MRSSGRVSEGRCNHRGQARCGAGKRFHFHADLATNDERFNVCSEGERIRTDNPVVTNEKHRSLTSQRPDQTLATRELEAGGYFRTPSKLPRKVVGPTTICRGIPQRDYLPGTFNSSNVSTRMAFVVQNHLRLICTFGPQDAHNCPDGRRTL